jgi:hypothetical protein
VYLGWNKNLIYNAPHSNIKINVDPKEKLFSLSSITSPAFAELGTNVDRQLAPYGEHRFESKYVCVYVGRRNGSKRKTPVRCAGPVRFERKNTDEYLMLGLF